MGIFSFIPFYLVLYFKFNISIASASAPAPAPEFSDTSVSSLASSGGNGNLMIARKADSNEGLYYEIFSFDPLTRIETKLSNTMFELIKYQTNAPIFSFDGTKVAFYGLNIICTMNSDGSGEKTILLYEPRKFFITGVSFSPDGNKLVLIGKMFSDGNLNQIYEMDANIYQRFKDLRMISNFKSDNFFNLKQPTYSPDGKFIVCLKKKKFEFGFDYNFGNFISIYDAETGELVNEFQTNAQVPSLETDSFVIIYNRKKTRLSIVFTEITAANGRYLSELSMMETEDNFRTFSFKDYILKTSAIIHSITWSPDLKFIVYTENLGLTMKMIDVCNCAVQTVFKCTRERGDEQITSSSVRWAFKN